MMIAYLLIPIVFILLTISVYMLLSTTIGAFPQKSDLTEIVPTNRFAIVIPAYNEAVTIYRTLASVLAVDYPSNSFDVYVIADNCTDNTAEVVARYGIPCLVRKDEHLRGKGHAIAWLLHQAVITDWPYDAVVIIDADSLVSRNLLKVMDAAFRNGAQALNCSYSILEPHRSVTASLSYFGFLLRNLRCQGIDRLGGSAPFLGNGMGFSMAIIRAYGWHAASITEDREHWADLHLHGIKVRFAGQASVWGAMPPTFAKYHVPRARWDLGEFMVFRSKLVPFLRKLGKRRDRASLLAILELMTPPFTLYGFFSALAAIGSIWIFTNRWWIILGLANLVLLVLCVGIGLLKAERDIRIYRNILLYLPFFIPWRLGNTLRGLFSRNSKNWVRTPRDIEEYKNDE